MKKLAPRTGAYTNEADVQDLAFLNDFYGQHQWPLGAIKRKYDPENVFIVRPVAEANDGRKMLLGSFVALRSMVVLGALCGQVFDVLATNEYDSPPRRQDLRVTTPIVISTS